MSLSIRSARDADIDPMAALLEELFTIETDFTVDAGRQREGLRLLLSRPEAVVLVAEDDFRIEGMCTLQTLVSTAEGGPVGAIEDVVVTASRRGRGIGSALLSEMEVIARARGLLRLQLHADRTNPPALEFYRQRGWRSTSLSALHLPLR